MQIEKMPGIIEFCLIHTDKEINWNKVEKLYGKQQTDAVKVWNEILNGGKK